MSRRFSSVPAFPGACGFPQLFPVIALLSRRFNACQVIPPLNKRLDGNDSLAYVIEVRDVPVVKVVNALSAESASHKAAYYRLTRKCGMGVSNGLGIQHRISHGLKGLYDYDAVNARLPEHRG